MKTQYAGIDYGLGKTNIDKASGIRYGVISQNSCICEAVDDIYTNGKDLALESALGELRVQCGDDDERLERETQQLCDCWETQLSNIQYEKDGYLITGCLDYDLFVLKSPYFTHAQFCSPCVPEPEIWIRLVKMEQRRFVLAMTGLTTIGPRIRFTRLPLARL